MECPKCHAQTGEGAKFCPQCGSDLKKARKEAEKGADGPTAKQAPKAGAQGGGAPIPRSAPALALEGAPLSKAAPAPSKEAKPKGSLGGRYVAGMVVIVVICIIALVLGIVTTVSNAEASQAASDSSQASSNPPAASPSQTAAQVRLANAQDCSSANSDNTLTEEGASNAYEFSVTGTSGWQGIMACVAQELSMPPSVQAKLKAFITKDAASQITSPVTSALAWTLQDGSSIYATYSAPLNGNGGWAVKFSNVRPELSGSSSGAN